MSPDRQHKNGSVFFGQIVEDLMAGYHGELRVLQVPIDQVKVRSAHATGPDPNPDRAGRGCRHRQLDRSQRLANTFENRGTHL